MARLHSYADCVDILRRARAQRGIKVKDELCVVNISALSIVIYSYNFFNMCGRYVLWGEIVGFGVC